MPTHRDRTKAREALRERIVPHMKSNPDLAFRLAEAVVDEFYVVSSADVGGSHEPSRALLPGLWVIRNDDLKALDGLWPVLGAMATLALGAHPGTVLLSTCLPALLKMFYNLATKRAALHMDQRQVVVAMKMLGRPASAAEIEALVDIGAVHAVESVLNELEKVRCVDGTLIVVAARGSDGLWMLAGV